MTTYVKIVNLDTESHKKFKELFSSPENSSFVDSFENLSKMYGENFNDDNPPSRDWMEENVGSKYIGIETSSPVDEGEFSSEESLIIDTAWSVPTEYLQKLVEVLGKEVAVYGTYEDESYSPMGAFVYADDYDDIEDLYEEDELNMIEMVENDEYLEDIYDQLYSHRDSLYESYLEVKTERENETNNEED